MRFYMNWHYHLEATEFGSIVRVLLRHRDIPRLYYAGTRVRGPLNIPHDLITLGHAHKNTLGMLRLHVREQQVPPCAFT